MWFHHHHHHHLSSFPFLIMIIMLLLRSVIRPPTSGSHRYHQIAVVTGFPIHATFLQRPVRNHDSMMMMMMMNQDDRTNSNRVPFLYHPQQSRLRYPWIRGRGMASVSGIIYDVVDDDSVTAKSQVVITLFTKEGCTLCDQVKDVLMTWRSKYPHQLVAVDITDPGNELWYDKYKYDIPVLHSGIQEKDDNKNNGSYHYWAKHRITAQQAELGLQQLQNGIPVTPIGTEPNAMNSRPKGSNNILDSSK